MDNLPEIRTKNGSTYIGIHCYAERGQCPTGEKDHYDPDCDWMCFCDSREALESQQQGNRKQLAALEAENKQIQMLIEKLGVNLR